MQPAQYAANFFIVYQYVVGPAYLGRDAAVLFQVSPHTVADAQGRGGIRGERCPAGGGRRERGRRVLADYERE